MPFPIYRPRRLRESPLLRSMVRETTLRADDFVYPLFAVHGRGVAFLARNHFHERHDGSGIEKVHAHHAPRLAQGLT